ncbi:MAG: ribosomal RNA small subunit methyltransferase A [Candidatus Yanofskybacteria bacterium RIFCSPHIGHO2_02_FULL_41_29]|uniref:Ribosomal RNA small subunit methyltransferase A n=1 Tax=Candidatus Yanofskybacteria bacterium RIFCSPHIGHO2_01_FULL_41_53 TaxID=1802663 RepID=A0A1F8EHB1_9BACT|nr:MAG: ribosomal RNA small subunit methyltransferase A [Candidatus Yanofskybacteria bacterium RIFCSPHIGHO2_01_FULL_41_53]OGN10882.1 MAG: ribosomal RNA small subunit methyltransferase A [Candidatus Yanofskybacteria bacterium RIFCSPHIGHO2_02_FULL_41_29]OGN16929.1 MAG: ribosomal RNA small subunit methyltransferase A [Candidatus Yanofskybacteria bacterium RIFCSPHIGHO2_12_FULL_41_9]OGN24455.1 MAG: ribosomal RNA small subunit methyltransferase A [Candidatus Yanofskybacteria bacterium RIFCSPLOWO2_01_F
MVTPKKSLGQNFLINPHILERIVDAAEVSKDDIVLEVGPGTGNLTKELAKKAGKVIAIEKDRRLVNYLKNEFSIKYATAKNVEIIEADILRWVPSQLRWYPSYKVVGNIPYYITSHFLRKVFEEWPTPKLIVLTIQKEVAQRIMAPSTSSGQAKPLHTNLLALSVQYYSEPEIVAYISKNNFRPVPKVDSTIIRLKVKSKAQNEKQTETIFKITRAGFLGKRKQLAGNLSKHLKISKEEVIRSLAKLSLNPTVRAEELSLDQWQELSKIL